MMCCYDPEHYIEIEEFGTISQGTEHCIECRELIHAGTPHYLAWSYDFDEEGEEEHLGVYTACEACGDLALSVFELGGCWSFGDLREDIREMNA